MAGHCEQDQDQHDDDECLHSSLNPLPTKDLMTGLALSRSGHGVPRPAVKKPG